MAVPIDHMQNVRGIAQGLQQAAPGLERLQAGDPLIDNFLNEYTRRREAGEPQENVMQDLLNKVKSTPELMQMPNPATSDVGTQNGQVAIGPQGGLTQPVASGANTMGNAPQAPPPAPAPAPMQPQPQQGGLQAAAAPTHQPVQQPSVRMFPPMGQPQSQGLVANGTQANLESQQVSSVGNNTFVSQPPPPAAPPMQSINLTRPQPMQTAVSDQPIPPPIVRNRGQQEDAMANVRQIESFDANRGSQDFKQQKLQADSTAKAIKSMVEMRKNDAKFMNDFAKFAQSVEGLDTKKQMFMAEMFMKVQMNDADNAAGVQRSRISASRPRSGGADKLPPKLAEIRRHYFEARGELSKYNVMGIDDDETRGKAKQARQLEKYWAAEYAKAAKEVGYPGTPPDITDGMED